jgi:hypothetical protein
MATIASQMLETAFKAHARETSDFGAIVDEMRHVIIQSLLIMCLSGQ